MRKRRGIWARLRARRQAKAAPGLEREKLASATEPSPPLDMSREQRWLKTLAEDVLVGKRREEVGGAEFWKLVDVMWERGDERLCVDWLEKFLQARNTPAEVKPYLRLRLAQFRDRRNELDLALAHLQALVQERKYVVPAHYLLAEYHRRRGHDMKAVQHYEAVLALDVNYPNVHSRVRALRERAGLSQAALATGVTRVGLAGGPVDAFGRYRLVAELGRGGAGIVYRALDTRLDRPCAIKVLDVGGPVGDDRRARCFAEARLVASLRHPHILAILDLDEATGRVVLELAEGGTLRQWIDAAPTTAPAQGARVREAIAMHQAALSALEIVHDRGIVHRDLKPENFLFRGVTRSAAEFVVADFGLAHLDDSHPGTGPAPDDVVGTMAYMAPEARRGEAVGPAADLYALGVVLAETLDSRVAGAGRRSWHRPLAAGELDLTGLAVSDDRRRALGAHLRVLLAPDPGCRQDATRALERSARLLAEAPS